MNFDKSCRRTTLVTRVIQIRQLRWAIDNGFISLKKKKSYANGKTLCNGNIKKGTSKPGAGYWTPTLDRNNDFLNWTNERFGYCSECGRFYQTIQNAARPSGRYSFLEKSLKELEEKKLSQMQTKRTLQENWETRIFDIICLLLTFYRNILRE